MEVPNLTGEQVTISTFRDLMRIFGVKMDEDHIFKYKGSYYELDKESPEFFGLRFLENPALVPQLKMQYSSEAKIQSDWNLGNAAMYQPQVPPMIDTQFQNQMRYTDQTFFSSRKQRSSSSYNRDSLQSPIGNASIQQQFQQQQYGLLPVLPGLFQLGNYYPPQGHYQGTGADFYKLYKQQSAAYQNQQQRFLETDQRFYQTLQQNRGNQQSQGKNQNEIHLAYLFASPLMLETSDNQYHDCLPPISFKEEFEQILLSLEGKNIGFRYRYMVANDANLRSCLNDNPIGLHFAGHGFENNVSLYKGDKKGELANKGKGDVLLFEKSDGSSLFYTEYDLSNLLETTFGHQRLEFVVVNSCHSECVGEIFRKSGAKHVICIDQKKYLEDDAAINFSRIFYMHVFHKNLSICEAFESARNHVRKQNNVKESEKFKLLLSKDHVKSCKKNEIRMRITEGQLQYIGVTPKILKLPAKVTPFISRNKDMLEVIQILNECNLVQIFGMPGLGKSSLIKNASNYIGERNLYRDGLIYMNFQTIKTFQEAIAFIMQNLEDNLDPSFMMNKVDLQFNQSFRKQEKVKLLKGIYKNLQKFRKGLLLVFDNIDDIAKDYSHDFATLITNIVQDSSNSTKILFSSSIFFEQLENYKIKKLRSLNTEDSVELFMTKLPLQNEDIQKFMDWSKIMELHQFTLERLGETNVKINLCKHRAHTPKCSKDYLVQHPLFGLLGGQPLSLSLIAPLSLKFSLKEIYAQLLDLPIMNVFKGKIKEDALILSLEFSLKILNDSQEKAVELFYLIGITKEGLFEDDLDQLFEEDDTQKKLHSLVELSLIQIETLDKSGKSKRFKVSPFIDKYVEQKLNQQSKRDLHFFLATYYTNKLIQLKKDYTKNLDQKALSDGLSKYEQNIIYCMKELFNMDYQRQIPTPSKKLGTKSMAVSPKSSKNKISKLVDKNLLEIGNATLKVRDSSGNAQSNRQEVKTAFKNPRLIGGIDGSMNLDVGNFKDYFEKRKLSNNGVGQKIQGYDSQTDKDGYQNSGVNESSSDYNTDYKNQLFITPKRDFKIRQSSAKGKKMTQTIEHSESQQSQSNSKPVKEEQTLRLGNMRVIKNFKKSDANIQQILQMKNDMSDLDSDVSPDMKNLAPLENMNKVLEKDKVEYFRKLNRLQKLTKQHINKNRFDQLVKSLTMRMGNSQTDNFDKLFKRGKLDFQSPLQEQLAQLNIYEKMCIHYISILALLDHRCQEVPKIIYSNENSSAALDKNELIIPSSNKLLQGNLKMVYIYYLLHQNKYDAVNGENLEMYSLFQDINCPLGEGVSLYLKAKYLQKMKRKNAYQKAEKYVLKSAVKFEQCQDSDGLAQCLCLLEKIQKSHPMINMLREKIAKVSRELNEENQEIQEDRLVFGSKTRDTSEDRVSNLLLNVIEYSYLKKEPIHKSPGGGIAAIKEQNMGQNFSPAQYQAGLNVVKSNRGATPKVFSKKMITLINQPKNAFQQDEEGQL